MRGTSQATPEPLMEAQWHKAEEEIARLRAQNAELLEALKEIETICNESAAECRKRMGTRIGNSLVVARATIKRAEEATHAT
jgi:type II secretory pathway component PulM